MILSTAMYTSAAERLGKVDKHAYSGDYLIESLRGMGWARVAKLMRPRGRLFSLSDAKDGRLYSLSPRGRLNLR
jgi:hypothetical protein